MSLITWYLNANAGYGCCKDGVHVGLGNKSHAHDLLYLISKHMLHVTISPCDTADED